jgi:glycerol-3-phosphate acyltransferase PlsY
LGSIPTAFIFGRLLGKIDIRKYGSGNVGATNVFRVMGLLPAFFVLAIDMGKGIIGVTLVGDIGKISLDIDRLLLGLSVICGHNWSMFLKFRGGKGVATSAGVLLGLGLRIKGLGIIFVICFLIWLIIVFLTRYVALGSICAALSLPAVSIISNQPVEIILFMVILSLYEIYRHKSNIKTLITGREKKIAFFKKSR